MQAAKTRDEIAAWLVTQIADLLEMSPEDILADEPLTYYGLSSADGAILSGDLEDWLGCELPATVAWEHPTVAKLADYLAAATKNGTSANEQAQAAHTTVADDADQPLSYGQRSLWFLHQLAPESSAYHISQAARIRSGLDVDALRRAYVCLIERHPALRTTFPSRNGQPVQRIGESPALDFAFENARTWSESELARRLETESARPFDLDEGPLLRVRIFTRGAEDYVMLVAIHHIVGDFWSFSVMIREVCAFYEAIVSGTQASLPALQSTYSEHARRQGELLAGGQGDRLWSYWQRQLGGMPGHLDLPTDRPRPRIQGFHGASLSTRLPAVLVEEVRALAAREEVTLFTFLLAAFATLLQRYSAQEEIVVGTPTSGRRRRDELGIVGYFVNPIVLRLDLSGDPRFTELLERARGTVHEALEHQDLPFPLLVERLHPHRDAARSPLFQVMLTMQQTALPQDRDFLPFALGEADARIEAGGLVLERVDLSEDASQFDLSLMVGDIEGDLPMSWRYDTDLFESSTIERMAAHYEALLGAIVADPDCTIGAFSFLSREEKTLLLDRWSQGEKTPVSDRCVTRAFEEQARSTPEVIALQQGDVTWTYGELNRRANRLARHLNALGVGAEDRVGICFDRSPELIQSIIAVLKAGGAYVPLDPDLPAERLSLMAADAAIAVLLCDAGHDDYVAGGDFTRVIVSPDESSLREYGDGDLESAPAIDALSQVLYTSGSTGVPKGVLLEHRGIVNRVAWMESYHPLLASDRVFQKAAYSFDVSVWEIFWPLVTGARLVLAHPGRGVDASYVARTIESCAITVAQFTPPLLREFVNAKEIAGCKSLRLVVSAGGALTEDLRRRFYEVSSAQLLNSYGPTETSDIVTQWPCGKEAGDGILPIGRPIANTSVYVLDARREPVPPGVAGVLHVGGVGVGRGYLNQPSLTQEKFLPNAFAENRSSRLYDTGDLVRYRRDGVLEFLGRVDGQIKVNGCRVEPEEVETALRRHPDVAEAVVALPRDGHRLLAYVVPARDATPAARDLRLFLRAIVPSYMVPSSIVVLEALPRNTNGKIDRRRLPAPAVDGDTSHAKPETDLERTLCSLWCTVLDTGEVGIDDDFFDLGGDSLGAVRLAALVSSTLGGDLPVKEILLQPTVRALAAALERGTDASHRHARARGPAEASRGRLAPISTEDAPVAPIDSAAIAYLPSSVLRALGGTPANVTREWMQDEPRLAVVHESELGRIGLILLPMFDVEVLADGKGRLAAEIERALELAARSGASVVSLTGVIPSVTGHGRELEGLTGDLALTTGHATTAAAVALTVDRCLREADRALGSSRAAFLGLGSIGTAVLHLLLERFPHPAEILLCDVYGRAAELERLRDDIASRFRFAGRIHILPSRGAVPELLYSADLIIGATTAPRVLDVDRLAPGTILVDDSAPHCFSVESAMQRFVTRGDVLLCEGGLVSAPWPFQRAWRLPHALDHDSVAQHVGELDGFDGHSITGCVLSGLLSVRFPELRVTLGMEHVTTAASHMAKLVELGFAAPPLRLDGRPLSLDTIARFARRFGNVSASAERWS